MEPTLSARPLPSSHRESTPTERFRRQHEELAVLGAEMLEQLGVPEEEIVKRAGHVRRLMARFAGKLLVHASMENEALYPRLLVHPDPAVRDKARTLFDDVKALYGALDVYSRRWPTTFSIEEAPALYAKDTRKVLKTLWMRMMRENEELYPLVDQAG